MSSNDVTPGRIVCEAWIDSHKRHHRCGITGWEDLSDEDRADWEAAAAAAHADGYDEAAGHLARGGSFR